MAISKIGSRAIIDGSVLAADFAPGTVTGAKLAGSIGNDKLANSAITIGGEAISLGGSDNSLSLIDWQSVVVSDGSTVTTMVAGRGYFVDSSGGTKTVTLPASPSIGDAVVVISMTGATNAVTIARNSSNIEGNASNLTLDRSYNTLTLIYSDANNGSNYLLTAYVTKAVELKDPTNPSKGESGNILFTLNEKFTSIESLKRHNENVKKNNYFDKFNEIKKNYATFRSANGQVLYLIR